MNLQSTLGRMAKAILPLKEGTCLGKVKGYPFKKELLTSEELNHHVHIVGASGYGKTVLITQIIKDKIKKNEGVMFIDLKGDRDSLMELTQCVAAAGRMLDLEIFNLADPKLSLSYNILGGGSYTQLRDKIMSSLTWSEEYYKSLSASFLLKALKVLTHFRDHNKEEITFKSILSLTKSVSEIENYLTKLKDSNQNTIRYTLEELYDFVKDRENYKSLQGLRSQLESLSESDFSENINPAINAINLFECVNQKKIVFIYLDSRRYSESAKAVGRFILQDLKSTSAKIDAEIPVGSRHPFTIIIDEFSDLAQEDFISFLDRARSSKLSLIIAHQELSDLQRISPEFMARLTGNTSTLYSFLQKNPRSAEMISGMAGTRTVWKTTKQTERFAFFEVDSGKGSKREVEEFNIHPNLVKSLGVGECVCIKKYPSSRSYLVKVRRGE